MNQQTCDRCHGWMDLHLDPNTGRWVGCAPTVAGDTGLCQHNQCREPASDRLLSLCDTHRRLVSVNVNTGTRRRGRR